MYVSQNQSVCKLHPDMRTVVEETIRLEDLMYSQPVNSLAVDAAASQGEARAIRKT